MDENVSPSKSKKRVSFGPTIVIPIPPRARRMRQLQALSESTNKSLPSATPAPSSCGDEEATLITPPRPPRPSLSAMHTVLEGESTLFANASLTEPGVAAEGRDVTLSSVSGSVAVKVSPALAGVTFTQPATTSQPSPPPGLPSPGLAVVSPLTGVTEENAVSIAHSEDPAGEGLNVTTRSSLLAVPSEAVVPSPFFSHTTFSEAQEDTADEESVRPPFERGMECNHEESGASLEAGELAGEAVADVPVSSRSSRQSTNPAEAVLGGELLGENNERVDAASRQLHDTEDTTVSVDNSQDGPSPVASGTASTFTTAAAPSSFSSSPPLGGWLSSQQLRAALDDVIGSTPLSQCSPPATTVGAVTSPSAARRRRPRGEDSDDESVKKSRRARREKADGVGNDPRGAAASSSSAGPPPLASVVRKLNMAPATSTESESQEQRKGAEIGGDTRSRTPSAHAEDATDSPQHDSATGARRCAFCGAAEVSSGGETIPFTEDVDGLCYHTACALWCPEVYFDVHHGTLCHLHEAVERAQHIKCAHCRKEGATIGCIEPSCQLSYHLPCALRATAALDQASFELRCPLHTPELHPKPRSKAVDTLALHS